MWLLNATTRKLENFISEADVPGRYAILSHTWGEDEVSFQEIQSEEARQMKGYIKIDFTCRQALQDGMQYAWVDTCCIDKKSSAELSEAINSMFRWYRSAKLCYAYLADVLFENDGATLIKSKLTAEAETQFRRSRWFTRGWTLQELIAPKTVRFFDRNWQLIGSKHGLLGVLSEITSIDVEVLEYRSKLPFASVAKRMSWAARRSTSREEDRAYSLLGLFDVNMPMLYGEGSKAFQRLQEEIIRTSTMVDHSILAWIPWKGEPKDLLLPDPYRDEPSRYQKVLSPSPYGFRNCRDIVSWTLPESETFEVSNRGLRMSLYAESHWSGRAREPDRDVSHEPLIVALNCRLAGQPMSHIALALNGRPRVDTFGLSNQSRDNQEGLVYDRVHDTEFRSTIVDKAQQFNTVEMSKLVLFTKTTLILAKEPYVWPHHGNKVHISMDEDLFVSGSDSRITWNHKLSIATLSTLESGQRFIRRYSALGYVELRSHNYASSIDGTSLYMKLNPQLQIGERRAIMLQTSHRHQIPNLDDRPCGLWIPMLSGQTEFFETADWKFLKITTGYVIMTGDILWDVNITFASRGDVEKFGQKAVPPGAFSGSR